MSGSVKSKKGAQRECLVIELISMVTLDLGESPAIKGKHCLKRPDICPALVGYVGAA
jgi:hypothetical protein